MGGVGEAVEGANAVAAEIELDMMEVGEALVDVVRDEELRPGGGADGGDVRRGGGNVGAGDDDLRGCGGADVAGGVVREGVEDDIGAREAEGDLDREGRAGVERCGGDDELALEIEGVADDEAQAGHADGVGGVDGDGDGVAEVVRCAGGRSLDRDDRGGIVDDVERDGDLEGHLAGGVAGERGKLDLAADGSVGRDAEGKGARGDAGDRLDVARIAERGGAGDFEFEGGEDAGGVGAADSDADRVAAFHVGAAGGRKDLHDGWLRLGEIDGDRDIGGDEAAAADTNGRSADGARGDDAGGADGGDGGIGGREAVAGGERGRGAVVIVADDSEENGLADAGHEDRRGPRGERGEDDDLCVDRDDNFESARLNGDRGRAGSLGDDAAARADRSDGGGGGAEGGGGGDDGGAAIAIVRGDHEIAELAGGGKEDRGGIDGELVERGGSGDDELDRRAGGGGGVEVVGDEAEAIAGAGFDGGGETTGGIGKEGGDKFEVEVAHVDAGAGDGGAADGDAPGRVRVRERIDGGRRGGRAGGLGNGDEEGEARGGIGRVIGNAKPVAREKDDHVLAGGESGGIDEERFGALGEERAGGGVEAELDQVDAGGMRGAAGGGEAGALEVDGAGGDAEEFDDRQRIVLLDREVVEVLGAAAEAVGGDGAQGVGTGGEVERAEHELPGRDGEGADGRASAVEVPRDAADGVADLERRDHEGWALRIGGGGIGGKRDRGKRDASLQNECDGAFSDVAGLVVDLNVDQVRVAGNKAVGVDREEDRGEAPFLDDLLVDELLGGVGVVGVEQAYLDPVEAGALVGGVDLDADRFAGGDRLGGEAEGIAERDLRRSEVVDGAGGGELADPAFGERLAGQVADRVLDDDGVAHVAGETVGDAILDLDEGDGIAVEIREAEDAGDEIAGAVQELEGAAVSDRGIVHEAAEEGDDGGIDADAEHVRGGEDVDGGAVEIGALGGAVAGDAADRADAHLERDVLVGDAHAGGDRAGVERLDEVDLAGGIAGVKMAEVAGNPLGLLDHDGVAVLIDAFLEQDCVGADVELEAGVERGGLAGVGDVDGEFVGDVGLD